MGKLKKFFSFEGYADDKRRIEELKGEREIRQNAVDRDASDAQESAQRIIEIDETLAELEAKERSRED